MSAVKLQVQSLPRSSLARDPLSFGLETHGVQVHLDGIVFSLQRHGGVTVYFRELLKRIGNTTAQLSLSLETPAIQQLAPGDAPAVHLTERIARKLERYRDCRRLPGMERAIFHSTYYRRPEDRRMPTVVTVHDFAYERTVSGLRTWIHSAQKYAAIHHAKAIICVSEATRDDLLDLVKLRSDQQVHVVHNGVSPDFHPLAEPVAAAAGRPFVLFVGQRGRYKNFRLALQAMELLPELELHCVGGGPLQRAELAEASEATRVRVKHLGFVTDSQLNRHYNHALCLLYPSAYEGFGIPVVEAMRAGCPVVSIACKAVLEVGGPALTVAEASATGLAQAVRLASSGANRGPLRAAGIALSQAFSWDRHFEQTLAVYRSLAA